MGERAGYPWLWDVEMDADTFDRVLRGEATAGGRDWRWALVRLVEYAPWPEIRRLLPMDRFVAHWPEVAPRVRSKTRREGMDYVHSVLRERRRAA